MKVLDPGHEYSLTELDAKIPTVQILRFVKRVGLGYPDNVAAHPGTTIQEVVRALIDRLHYVREQSQKLADPLSVATDFRCIKHLREVLWLLEERAARRHGREWPCMGTIDPEIERMPTCANCGHIKCEGACRP
jgi:hypothetical protein